MKNEAAVWNAFRMHIPKGMMVRRIEDQSGNLGTWDVWIGSMGGGVWLEFKHTETVKRKPKQRKGQYAFGCDLTKAGVAGAYVVGSSDNEVRIMGRMMIDDQWQGHLLKRWPDGVTQANVRGLLRELAFSWLPVAETNEMKRENNAI